MDRDWSYFAFIAAGAVLLWLLHRRRRGHRRGFVPIVIAILAIIGALYLVIRL